MQKIVEAKKEIVWLTTTNENATSLVVSGMVMAAAMSPSSGAIGAVVTLTTPIRNAMVVRVMVARDMNAAWMNGKEIAAVKALGDKATAAVRINGKAIAVRTMVALQINGKAAGAARTLPAKAMGTNAIVAKATAAAVVAA